MIFCGICQGTIDKQLEINLKIVSICLGCRQRLTLELPGTSAPAVFKKYSPISQAGFSAFSEKLQRVYRVRGNQCA